MYENQTRLHTRSDYTALGGNLLRASVRTCISSLPLTSHHGDDPCALAHRRFDTQLVCIHRAQEDDLECLGGCFRRDANSSCLRQRVEHLVFLSHADACQMESDNVCLPRREAGYSCYRNDHWRPSLPSPQALTNLWETQLRAPHFR